MRVQNSGAGSACMARSKVYLDLALPLNCSSVLHVQLVGIVVLTQLAILILFVVMSSPMLKYLSTSLAHAPTFEDASQC